jgi:hypothetical protein
MFAHDMCHSALNNSGRTAGFSEPDAQAIIALLIKNPPFFVNHMMVLLHARAL